MSTPQLRAIAITTRMAPIELPPASKKLVSAAKLLSSTAPRPGEIAVVHY
jgi:hypothetical protein